MNVLTVEALGKRTTDVHDLRYMPALSVGARLRDRRGERLPSGFGDDFEDDEEDDEEVDEGEEFEQVATAGEWAVRDVSFAVAPGEALGLVGDRASIISLQRVLAGMTAPSEGRFSYRGRAGMSAEMALLLSRREMVDTRLALQTLALLAGVGRRRRRAWMREVGAFVAGTEGPSGKPTSKTFRTNLAIAAALDPTADVLFVDRLPRVGADGMLQRAVERLRGRLAAGAGALVTVPDVRMVEMLCSRVVQLEAGRVVQIGPVADVVTNVREERRQTRTLKPFSADAAILSAEVVDDSGEPARQLLEGGPFRMLVRIETATPDVEVTWRVRLAGETRPWAFSQPGWHAAGEPGVFLVALELPLVEWIDDEYDVAVDAVLRFAGRNNVSIRRAIPGRFPVVEAGAQERGEGVFDGTNLRATWARVEPAPVES